MKILVILFFLMVASNLNASDIEQKNQLFTRYLKENHKLEIPESRQLFFVFSAAGCETCQKLDFEYLHKIAKLQNLKLIISYPRAISLPQIVVDLVKEENVLLDRGNYFRWNITPLSDGFLVTEKGKVIKIFEIDRWNSQMGLH